jgi:type IV pilus assembly protein PilF
LIEILFMIVRSICLLIAVSLLQSCQQAQNSPYQEAALYNTQLGLAYLKQGDRPRAKRKLVTALAQAPNSPSVNAGLAYFMEKTGEMKRAAFYYRQAMLLAPGRGAQLNNYGAFLCRRGHYRAAETYFLKAVNDAQYEHTASAYENAGLCAMAIPDYPKAIHYFKKALEHDPLRKQSLNELVKIEKTHTYRSKT